MNRGATRPRRSFGVWSRGAQIAACVLVGAGLVSGVASPAVAQLRAAPEPRPVESVHMGVLNAPAFRYVDPRDPDPDAAGAAPLSLARAIARPLLARAPGRASTAPLSFVEQLRDEGFTVFHLPIVDDPQSGAFARGAMANVVPLQQAGVKVLDLRAPDPDAACFTLMTCLMMLEEAVAEVQPERPVLALVDARAPSASGRRSASGRLSGVGRVPGAGQVAGAARRLGLDRLGGEPTERAAPDHLQIANEVRTVMAERGAAAWSDTAGRSPGVRVLVVGAAGDAPDAPPYHVLADAAETPAPGAPMVFDADTASPVALSTARGHGHAVMVVGAAWEEPPRLDHIGPRQAYRLGADVIVLTPHAARTRPMSQ